MTAAVESGLPSVSVMLPAGVKLAKTAGSDWTVSPPETPEPKVMTTRLPLQVMDEKFGVVPFPLPLPEKLRAVEVYPAPRLTLPRLRAHPVSDTLRTLFGLTLTVTWLFPFTVNDPVTGHVLQTVFPLMTSENVMVTVSPFSILPATPPATFASSTLATVGGGRLLL